MGARIVLAVVVFILGIAVEGHAQKPEMTEIDAWLVRDLQMSSQFAVADKMGYFKEDGLKVNPRWYIAGRAGYARATAGPPVDVYEVAVGYRPGAHQVLKAGYEVQHGPALRGTLANALVVQVVTSFRVWSVGR